MAEVCGDELDESNVVIAHYCVVYQRQIDLCSDLSLLSFSIRRTINDVLFQACLLYTSPSPRDSDSSRMPSSA